MDRLLERFDGDSKIFEKSLPKESFSKNKKKLEIFSNSKSENSQTSQ